MFSFLNLSVGNLVAGHHDVLMLLIIWHKKTLYVPGLTKMIKGVVDCMGI